MAHITFTTPSGETVTIEATGGSLMENAKEHAIEGIEGDCGGVCSCSTCHVYVAEPWRQKLEPADELEADTLEFDDRRKANSRLSCQIEVTEALDGLEVTVAPEA